MSLHVSAALALCASKPDRTRPLLWLDHFEYSGALLARDEIPWLEPAALLAYYRTAHGLLRPDVAVLPVQRVFEAWLAAHPELAGEMAGKRRPGFALRTLLAASGPRALLAEIAAALREGWASAPLFVAAPAPRRWLSWAHARAHGQAAETEVGGDDAESAAVYVADFLRTFADCRIDGLLLEEAPAQGPTSQDEVGWYRPVLNVARHYRWEVGIELSGSSTASGAATGALGVDFLVGDRELTGRIVGAVLDAAFWAGTPAPSLGGPGLYFARVPRGALPERVLERLATLW